MKYKIRVFNYNTNKEAMSIIDEVFESKEATKAEIEPIGTNNPKNVSKILTTCSLLIKAPLLFN
ncbi:hypothetical protein [Bacillus sp. EB600]|uniref:hypothetical protein n=1 Tax=Bacillus sp. EB600 TaxID=2806345 RepID=UPI00210A1585|nr:hypothetical protein [Bacillus sp. EB600]MCQ6282671.1 hypothetical protein [Bacillus sp. EB600]